MKDLKTTFTEKKESGHNKMVQDKLDVIDEDKGIAKEMIERMERQGNKETSSIWTICKKMEKDIEKERDMIRKEKEDSLVEDGKLIVVRKMIV